MKKSELPGRIQLDLSPITSCQHEPPKSRSPCGEFTQVIPNLFISNEIQVRDRHLLLENRIQVVICLSAKRSKIQYQKHFQYFAYPIKDDPNLFILSGLQRLIRMVMVLLSKKRRVLIFDESGVSKSLTVVLAIMIRYGRKSLEESFRILEDKEVIANPNIGFLLQLKKLEKRSVRARHS